MARIVCCVIAVIGVLLGAMACGGDPVDELSKPERECATDVLAALATVESGKNTGAYEMFHFGARNNRYRTYIKTRDEFSDLAEQSGRDVAAEEIRADVAAGCKGTPKRIDPMEKAVDRERQEVGRVPTACVVIAVDTWKVVADTIMRDLVHGTNFAPSFRAQMGGIARYGNETDEDLFIQAAKRRLVFDKDVTPTLETGVEPLIEPAVDRAVEYCRTTPLTSPSSAHSPTPTNPTAPASPEPCVENCTWTIDDVQRDLFVEVCESQDPLATNMEEITERPVNSVEADRVLVCSSGGSADFSGLGIMFMWMPENAPAEAEVRDVLCRLEGAAVFASGDGNPTYAVAGIRESDQVVDALVERGASVLCG